MVIINFSNSGIIKQSFQLFQNCTLQNNYTNNMNNEQIFQTSSKC